MNSTIESLRIELDRSKNKKIPTSTETKMKIVSMIDENTSSRKLAELLGIHHTTITRWGQKKSEMLLQSGGTTGACTGDNQEEGGASVACTTHRPLHQSCTTECKDLKLKDSPPCTTPAPPKFLLSLLVITFLMCEYYLLSEAYRFHFFTLKDERFALIKSLLGELVPIILTAALFSLKVKIIHKLVINFCLCLAFLFSAYISGAHQFNGQSDQLEKFSDFKERDGQLLDAIKSKKSSIKYFKNVIQQSTGIKGWPNRVIQYEKELNDLLVERKKIKEEMGIVGNHGLKNFNRWVDIFFKIFLQLACVVMISILSINLPKFTKSNGTCGT